MWCFLCYDRVKALKPSGVHIAQIVSKSIDFSVDFMPMQLQGDQCMFNPGHPFFFG